MPCCNLGSSEQCIEQCRRTLRLQIDDQDKLVEELEKDCGYPSFTVILIITIMFCCKQFLLKSIYAKVIKSLLLLFQEPLWQCFLLDANNNIKRHKGTVELTGVDGAKLQCCLRASSTNCREICIRVRYNAYILIGFCETCE